MLLLLAALYHDYADEDITDVDVHDTDIPDAVPAEEQSAQATPSPSSVPPADEAAYADSPSPSPPMTPKPTQSCTLPRKPARFAHLHTHTPCTRSMRDTGSSVLMSDTDQ